MRIAICDDTDLQLKLLTKYCTSWSIEKKEVLKLQTYSSAEAFIFDYEDNKGFDILLLDIQMKDMTGIDLAKKLRSLDDNVAIIFITGVKDYVFEGYHVQAIDYLIKPVDEKSLYNALDTAYNNLSKRDAFLLLQLDGETKKIKQKDIYYIESIGHNTIFYCQEGNFEIKKGIAAIEKELTEQYFNKCHRSYIINILHIDSISKAEVILTNKSIIPIARGKWEGLNKAFLDYYRSKE